jgi:hypothetical protein
MKFKDFLTEKVGRRVIVVYGGGFQPFHHGHMSSYVESKRAFPRADYYVAASGDVKLRPIPFGDKKFLAQQAGVTDNFVQVTQPLNPQEIIKNYDENKDILILVRSEKDFVKYTKKDGSPAYYQPFVSIDKCKPFKQHAYIFMTKKKVFRVAGKQVDSGGQIRRRYMGADDTLKRQMIADLYPRARQPAKIKSLLDKYLVVQEDLDLEFEELLTEGVHDKGIFKAVFLAGGPGSGKDYVLDNTLQGHGLTEINLDKAIEFLRSKKGVDEVTNKAKNTTELRQKLALKGRNGLIINGTGDDLAKITQIKTALENLGYDTSMIMVNTADEVSAQRNIERGQRGGRTVPETIRKQKWDAAQDARTEFAKMFGDRYMEFDNSEDLRNAPPEVVKQKKDEMLQLYKNIQDFVAQPPQSEMAQAWVADQMQQKDTQPIPKGGAEMSPHPGSNAAQQARELGLQYYGFGRYGRDGQVTHRSVHDQLVAVQDMQKEDIDLEFEEMFSEDLRQWFSKSHPEGDWKRINSKGEAIGPCAREPGEPKPKCMSREKRQQLSKKERAAAVAVKRKHDPNPERKGKPINVSNYGKGKLSELYDLSDSSAMNLLLLGRVIDEHDLPIGEQKDAKLLKDKAGRVRVFMLRAAAAREAHTTNGTVLKYKNGYVIQLKENEDVEISKRTVRDWLGENRERPSVGHNSETLRETSGRTETTGLPTESATCEEGTTETIARSKISLAEIRQRKAQKEINGCGPTRQSESTQINEIDKGIEPGLSMAGAGESIGRDMGEKIKKKSHKVTTVEAIGAGGEMATSMSDYNENDLKRKGINLKSFKAKRPIG